MTAIAKDRRNRKTRGHRRSDQPRRSDRSALINWKRRNGLNQRIFVQIASYRDPECQWTLKDMFEKAANPDRVFAGVVWQYLAGEDEHCFLVETRPEQVRMQRINARFSQGVCWARSMTQQLWQGEEYTLQIDSHTRFEPDWDQKLICMSRQTGSPKPVITCYPPAYTPPDKLYTGQIYAMGAKEFDRDGMFTMEGRGIAVENAPSKPIPGVFCSACFLFAPSAIIREVPYDPNIYFLGEEITLAVRLWTHGWDLFYPNMPVLYTNWDRNYRKTHFEDHRDWGTLNRRSHQRVHYLLAGQEPADPTALDDIEKFGLGSVRTLQEYQRYSGVNFRKKIFNARAHDDKPYPPFKGRARCSQRAVRNGTVSLTPAFHPESFRGSEVDARPESSSTVSTVSPFDSARALISNGHHHPRKVFESIHGIVFDDFLPEELYQKLYHYACTADYEHINTTGKIQRVWRIRDGFPLRSQFNLFHFVDESKRPFPKPDWAYPTNTALDLFADNLSQLSTDAAPVIGQRGKDWDRYSVTSWIYPRDTALSLHDDGSGVYSGAFTYFLNPHWDIHWGGLLMFIDPSASKALQKFKTPRNVHDYYKKKWLDSSGENAFVWEPGLAQCIFPKRNRLVFIHPESYHFVTKVTADAGENARMSFAGFFIKPEQK
jgi:hypothetical protein